MLLLLIVVQGLLGFDSVTIGPSIAPVQVSHWRGIKEVLEANGTEVLITRVPATSSPVDRAKVLEEKISAVYPGRSVHLIGHSMGVPHFLLFAFTSQLTRLCRALIVAILQPISLIASLMSFLFLQSPLRIAVPPLLITFSKRWERIDFLPFSLS